MKYPKEANTQRQKLDHWFPGAGERRDNRVTGNEFLFWRIKMFKIRL